MNKLVAIQVFCEIVDRQTMSAAARSLGMSNPSVTAHLNTLEDSLGIKLLVRTTRRVTLTDEGSVYYAHCKGVLEQLTRADDSVSQTAAGPKGVVRITATAPFVRNLITPMLPGFFALYPELRVELVVTESVVDLVAEHIDVAYRSGPLEDSAMVARKLFDYRWVLLASAAYVARCGAPASIDELASHTHIGFGAPQSQRPRSWQFQLADGVTQPFEPRCRLLVSTFDAARDAVQAGIGIAALPSITVREQMASGELVEILPTLAPQELTQISMITTHGRFAPPRVKAFVDYMLGSLAERGLQDPGPSLSLSSTPFIR
jgi:LysR family transcriptional regulator, regulator for bpeEF and oprC